MPPTPFPQIRHMGKSLPKEEVFFIIMQEEKKTKINVHYSVSSNWAFLGRSWMDN